MLRDLTNPKKVTKEAVLAAIQSIRSKEWDINPYTVADEVKVQRSAIYRDGELMDIIADARSRDGKPTDSAQEHVVKRAAYLEGLNRELEERLYKLEKENADLQKREQEAWHNGYNQGKNEAQGGRPAQPPLFGANRPSQSTTQNLSTSASMSGQSQPTGTTTGRLTDPHLSSSQSNIPASLRTTLSDTNPGNARLSDSGQFQSAPSDNAAAHGANLGPSDLRSTYSGPAPGAPTAGSSSGYGTNSGLAPQADLSTTFSGPAPSKSGLGSGTGSEPKPGPAADMSTTYTGPAPGLRTTYSGPSPLDSEKQGLSQSLHLPAQNHEKEADAPRPLWDRKQDQAAASDAKSSLPEHTELGNLGGEAPGTLNPLDERLGSDQSANAEGPKSWLHNTINKIAVDYLGMKAGEEKESKPIAPLSGGPMIDPMAEFKAAEAKQTDFVSQELHSEEFQLKSPDTCNPGDLLTELADTIDAQRETNWENNLESHFEPPSDLWGLEENKNASTEEPNQAENISPSDALKSATNDWQSADAGQEAASESPAAAEEQEAKADASAEGAGNSQRTFPRTREEVKEYIYRQSRTLSPSELAELLKHRPGAKPQEEQKAQETHKGLAGSLGSSGNRSDQETTQSGFVLRSIPPDIRKACLMLGLRPEELTYETVHTAWKREITRPGTHPDLGGDSEMAVYLNTAKDQLLHWVESTAPKLAKQFGHSHNSNNAPTQQGREPGAQPGAKEDKE